MLNYTTKQRNQPKVILTDNEVASCYVVADLKHAASKRFNKRGKNVSPEQNREDDARAFASELALAHDWRIPPQTGYNKFGPNHETLPDMEYRNRCFDLKSNTQNFPNILIAPDKLQPSWTYVMCTGSMISREMFLCGYIKGSDIPGKCGRLTDYHNGRAPVWSVNISMLTPFTGSGSYGQSA